MRARARLRYFPVLMNSNELNVTKQTTSDGWSATVRLDGKLSLETVSDFLTVMREEPAAALVLDMSGVKFLDSAGIGALVQLFVHRRNHSQKFALAALNPQGLAVVEVAGLQKLLPIYSSTADALTSFV